MAATMTVEVVSPKGGDIQGWEHHDKGRAVKVDRLLADASAEAIKRVAAALGSDDAPVRYLLGEKYIKTLGDLASSENAKTVVLPADLQDALRGMFGKARI